MLADVRRGSAIPRWPLLQKRQLRHQIEPLGVDVSDEQIRLESSVDSIEQSLQIVPIPLTCQGDFFHRPQIEFGCAEISSCCQGVRWSSSTVM